MSVSKKNTIRVNRAIIAPEVRLVDPEGVLDDPRLGGGEHIGIMSVPRALGKAEMLGLDLVEVSPNASPPVVRVMDYGKYLFELKKSKKKQKASATKIKEVKFRPVTEIGDYQVKLRNLMGFLSHGDKVKVTMRFRGREMAHQQIGRDLLDRLIKDVDGHGTVDQMPKMEGRQMVMVISPDKRKT